MQGGSWRGGAAYSEVESDLGILLLDPCKEAGFLARRKLVGEGGGGGGWKEEGEQEGRKGEEEVHSTEREDRSGSR